MLGERTMMVGKRLAVPREGRDEPTNDCINLKSRDRPGKRLRRL